jgi:hypothetical protein
MSDAKESRTDQEREIPPAVKDAADLALGLLSNHPELDGVSIVFQWAEGEERDLSGIYIPKEHVGVRPMMDTMIKMLGQLTSIYRKETGRDKA